MEQNQKNKLPIGFKDAYNGLTNFEKIEKIHEHIMNVQRNTFKLGMKFIKRGEVEMGRMLIANGQIHDNSKFKGIEFDRLFKGDPLLEIVVKHHSSTNAHHPEFWGTIHAMPDVYIAEMACDMCARSSEFGSNPYEWFEEYGTKKFSCALTDSAVIKLYAFMDELLDKPFESPQ